ncbi:hypothetical protein MRX96_002993 [Rhipicephalus microplus]
MIANPSCSANRALSPHGDIEISALYSAEIPLIAIVCQGGTGCNKMVLEHVKKQLPVLVIQGSGGVADLLALAYNEIDRRGATMWDPEFIENVLKPEINSHICRMFPKFRDNALSRNLFKDRIVECLRIACQQRQHPSCTDSRSSSVFYTNNPETALKLIPGPGFPQRMSVYFDYFAPRMSCPDRTTATVN